MVTNIHFEDEFEKKEAARKFGQLLRKRRKNYYRLNGTIFIKQIK